MEPKNKTLNKCPTLNRVLRVKPVVIVQQSSTAVTAVSGRNLTSVERLRKLRSVCLCLNMPHRRRFYLNHTLNQCFRRVWEIWNKLEWLMQCNLFLLLFWVFQPFMTTHVHKSSTQAQNPSPKFLTNQDMSLYFFGLVMFEKLIHP